MMLGGPYLGSFPYCHGNMKRGQIVIDNLSYIMYQLEYVKFYFENKFD